MISLTQYITAMVMVSLITGIFLLLLGMVRFGSILRYPPPPVLHQLLFCDGL